MIVRVQFQKGEEVKYVGHLDTMRTFVRCLKRTNIPVEYSKGFNPRIQISFALPLGVGMTSDSEYFDLVLSAEMNPQMFLAEFNSVLPMGFHVTSAKYIKENKKSLMSLVKEAKYEILLDTQCSRETIEDFFHQSEIVFQKEEVVKGKRKETKINLKPMIISYEIKEQAKQIMLFLHATAGSIQHLNPQNLIIAMKQNQIEIQDYEIKRKELILQEN